MSTAKIVEESVEAPSRRALRRRRGFRMPPPAVPVKGLWAAAAPEARERAHRSANLLLQSWVGLKSRSEAAKELGIPPVRLWQLNQQALSGMVAGLLKQPRGRKGAVPMDPEEDPKVLRKRIRQLEADLDAAKRLIEVLKDLPENRPQIVEVKRRKGRHGKGETVSGERPEAAGTKPPSGGPTEAR